MSAAGASWHRWLRKSGQAFVRRVKEGVVVPGRCLREPVGFGDAQTAGSQRGLRHVSPYIGTRQPLGQPKCLTQSSFPSGSASTVQ
jgi:hypothetical protein